MKETEEKINRYEQELTEYLHKISMQNILPENSDDCNMLLYCIRDFERMSDHACNIADESAKIAKSGAIWPKKTKKELKGYAAEIQNIVSVTVDAFVQRDTDGARAIEAMEEKIDELNKKVKKQNLKRAKKEKCSPEIGIFMNELSIYFERVADHCENVAISMLGQTDNEDGEEEED